MLIAGARRWIRGADPESLGLSSRFTTIAPVALTVYTQTSATWSHSLEAKDSSAKSVLSKVLFSHKWTELRTTKDAVALSSGSWSTTHEGHKLSTVICGDQLLSSTSIAATKHTYLITTQTLNTNFPSKRHYDIQKNTRTSLHQSAQIHSYGSQC